MKAKSACKEGFYASQKLHESLGFSRVGEDGDSYIYEYILK